MAEGRGLENNLLNVRVGDPIFDFARRRVVSAAAERLGKEERALLLGVQQLQLAAADNYFLHYSLHPIFAPSNPDELMRAILEAQRKYAATGAYRAARLVTVLDDALSLIHSIAFTRELVRQLLERMRTRLGGERLQRVLERLGLGGGAQGGEAPPLALSELGLSELAIESAVREAGEAAGSVTSAAKNILDLCGGGVGKGVGDIHAVLDLADAVLTVRGAEEVVALAKRIADALPRFAAIRKQRGKRGAAFAGYALTSNPERAAPREFALPDELFYAKLASGSLLRREMLTVKEGAYYVLLDKSGSMDGEKTVWSRSVALALLSVARRRHRRFLLRFFDGVPHDLLSDGDAVGLVKALLRVRPSGGTRIDAALRAALGDLKRGFSELTNTIVIVTDGEDTVTVKPEELREVGAALVAVMIHGSNEALRLLAERSGGRYMRATLTERGALQLVDMLRKR